MWSRRNRNRLFRLGQVAALAVMAVLGLLDLNTGLAGAGGFVLLQILTAMATAAVWLPRHQQGSTTLPKVAVAVSCASLLLTFAVLLNGTTHGSFGSAEALGLLGILYVVSRRGDAGWAVIGVGTTVVAVGLLPLRGGTEAVYVIVGLILALAAATSIGAGVYLRTLSSARQRAMDAVRNEQRTEFARDLHDFIAHHVTGIVVQAQGARFIAEQDPKRVLLALEQIEQAGAETMASMRRMVGVLRDPKARPDAPLAPIAGVPDLGALLEQFTAAGGAIARLHTDGELDGLPVEVSTSAYRVVMEALTNIRQHAQAARVADVWVRRTRDWLLVRVANDGAPQRATGLRERPGAVPTRAGKQNATPGYGLVGLTERVRAVGGRITAGPGIDGGWVVDAALPLNREVAR